MLTLWLPGKIGHEQDRTGWHWLKRARYVRSIHDRVAQHVLFAVPGRRIPWPAEAPKVVTFTAHVGRAFDDDNLAHAFKHHRDALRKAGLINDDRRSAGHTFRYEQEVSRGRGARRGVEITVALAELTPAHAGKWS